jgi:hypothetical protein
MSQFTGTPVINQRFKRQAYGSLCWPVNHCPTPFICGNPHVVWRHPFPCSIHGGAYTTKRLKHAAALVPHHQLPIQDDGITRLSQPYLHMPANTVSLEKRQPKTCI